MHRILISAVIFILAGQALADKPHDIWTMAEARIIAERCPYAAVDERIMAGIVERAHIDLKENTDDRAQYAYLKEDRRDQLWARSEQQMCTRGWIGYGPTGIHVRNLLIFHWPSRNVSAHMQQKRRAPR